MGFSVTFYQKVSPTPRLRISNLTYNYSTPECMAYWYGRDDLHGKTVADARERMLEAIERMEKDGIAPNEQYRIDTSMVKNLLMWLKSAYGDLEHIDNEFVIMLD